MVADLKETIAKATKNIGETSSQFLKSTKLNMDISAEEDKLRKAYVEIGRKVHEIYTYGGSLGQFFDEKYMELQTIQSHIDALKKDLADLKGTKVCPQCKKAIDLSAEYCPKCGNCVMDEKPVQQPGAPEMFNAANAIICPVCNITNTRQDKFCKGCGRFL